MFVFLLLVCKICNLVKHSNKNYFDDFREILDLTTYYKNCR